MMVKRVSSDYSFGEHLDGQYDVAGQLRSHIARRTALSLDRGVNAKDAIENITQLQDRQAWVRQFVQGALLGNDADRHRQPPSAVCVGAIPRDCHSIEKLILESDDGSALTANLYLPHEAVEPGPAVLFCPGHALEGKAAPAYHAACTTLARSGFVVLAYDTIGQGERLDLLDSAGRPMVAPNVPQHNHLGVKAWWTGDTPARYFIEDARRALDYLLSRPEVDPQRVAALGNSGGGTMVSWLAFVERRLAAVAISCFLSGIAEIQASGIAQDSEQILPGGVEAGIDHDDVALAMVPRPMLVLSKNSDFFPIEGAVRVAARARRWYQLAGVPGHFSHIRDTGTHGLSQALAESAAEFFTTHLGSRTTLADGPAELVDATELQCTQSGQLCMDRAVVPAREANAIRLHHIPEPDPESATNWLRQRVWAAREPRPEMFPRSFDTSAPGVRKMIWWSEVDLLNNAVVFDPVLPAKSVEILLLDSGTDDLARYLSYCQQRQQAGRTVVVLDTRGTGALSPRSDNLHALEAHYGTIFRMTSDLIALGDSLAAGRIHDVLRTLDLISDPGGLDLAGVHVGLVGAGHGAFLALAAAAVDDRIRTVTCLSPVFDPVAEVTQMFHGAQRDIALVIPGMARFCPQGVLRTALGSRLRLAQDTADSAFSALASGATR